MVLPQDHSHFFLFTLGHQVDVYNQLHQAPSQSQQQSQQQNIVVNVASPQEPNATATKSAERQILELPDEKPLSLKEIMLKTSLELDVVESTVNKLVEKGLAQEIVV